MKRKILGSVLLVIALVSVLFLCTDIRLKPEIRSSYEIGQTEHVENDDMALLLQMLNSGGGAGE